MSDIIKFAIKALIAGAIVWALYNHFSPLQNCLRMIESGGLELEQLEGTKSVSYTHLTLPTIYSV